MPELPEVEITRVRMLPLLRGRRIARVTTTPNSYFFLTHPRILRRVLPGRQILDFRRRGKYLYAPLDDGSTLHLHLGMTGQFLASGAASLRLSRASGRSSPESMACPRFIADEHTHLVLEFEDGSPAVMLRDVRKFGKCAWRAAGESEPRHAKLGIDALLVSGESLYAASRRRSIDIKTLLLDQSVLAGVGNIYADESLFLAGLRPTRQAGRLTLRDCSGLAAAVRTILTRGIELGGSSISDFVHPDGSDGGFQHQHQVYARTGEPCRTCGAAVLRLVTRGRSTHFCPSCQR